MGSIASLSTVDSEIRSASDVGPCLHAEGVTYRVWAFGHASVITLITGADGNRRALELLSSKKEDGFFEGNDSLGKVGDLYQFSIDGADPVPDFASCYQPKGVHGPSMVVDARAFSWNANWTRPAWNGQVIYECHIGAFTPEGTFCSAIDKLDHLCDLGVNALEIMPVAGFHGKRNWGYDGVMLFAPSHAYGTPDDFRSLIDACHRRGLAVILDVVFNHLGPEGNYSHQYSDYYFHEAKDSPWGQSFNLDGPHSGPVRALLRQNIRYWLDDFRIDGFRMDATHAIHDESEVHILAQIAEIAHGRGAFVIAEDERNACEILEPRDKGGWNFDAAWADDFHHVARVSQTGEQHHYYSRVRGSLEELARTLRQGWLFPGEFAPVPAPRERPLHHFSPSRFVYCISNHDQVGNRLLGDRFHHAISPASYRALSLFLCLVPYTPLLFMGQEWAATSPFLYFTDMPEELGQKIYEGRQREFLLNCAGSAKSGESVSNPQDDETFTRSKLDWTEIAQQPHRQCLDLYRAGLKLRRELFGAANPPRDGWSIEERKKSAVIHYRQASHALSVYLNMESLAEDFPDGSTILLRSNGPEYSGLADGEGPETVVVSYPNSNS